MSNKAAKPRILLLGTTGQIGRELAPLLDELGQLTALQRQQLDLSQPDEIRRVIRGALPEVIVNAAAYTAVDPAESDEAAARAINAIAPGVIAEEAKQLGALLVHYSTDYVFDGAKRNPYDEDDPPSPINAYGRTKLEGERAIEQTGCAYLIFRTAWVYAREGRNFLLTVLRLAAEKEELRIVRDQVGAPTSSREIAGATANVLSQICSSTNGASPWTASSGIYHMTAAGETTWYDFARRILELASTRPRSADWVRAATGNRPLIARKIVPITTAEFPTPARRPAFSVLSNRRLKQAFGISLPHWEMQLRAVFADELADVQPQGAMREQRGK
jgi:dTDP-4-dehydrorhamnose reductase